MDYGRPLRHQTTAARAFLIGACCGLVGGAVLTWLLVTRSGLVPGARGVEGDRAVPVVLPIERQASSETAESRPDANPVAGTSGTRSVERSEGEPVVDAAPAAELARRSLLVPVEGVAADQLVPSFTDKRGLRDHEAIDILAPRHTPVLAVEEGRIARLFHSTGGGLSIYQFDPTEQYCYFYAHLERYAEGLTEGQEVRKGQVIGYVGVSGNAPKDTPHLHFAILRLTPAKRWWEGTPIDPFEVFGGAT